MLQTCPTLDVLRTGEGPEEEEILHKSELTCAGRWLPKSRSWQIFWVKINLAVPVVNTIILFPLWFRECNCHAHDLFENILPGCLNEWGSQHFEMGGRGTSSSWQRLQQAGSSHPCPSHKQPVATRTRGTWELRESSHTPRWPFLNQSGTGHGLAKVSQKVVSSLWPSFGGYFYKFFLLLIKKKPQNIFTLLLNQNIQKLPGKKE